MAARVLVVEGGVKVNRTRAKKAKTVDKVVKKGQMDKVSDHSYSLQYSCLLFELVHKQVKINSHIPNLSQTSRWQV